MDESLEADLIVRLALFPQEISGTLWYPVGYGEQPLYDVQVKVFDDVRFLFSRRNLFTQAIIVVKPVIGYQDPKDRVPPRARC